MKHIAARVDLKDIVVVDIAYSVIQYKSTIKQLKQMGKLTRGHTWLHFMIYVILLKYSKLRKTYIGGS